LGKHGDNEVPGSEPSSLAPSGSDPLSISVSVATKFAGPTTLIATGCDVAVVEDCTWENAIMCVAPCKAMIDGAEKFASCLLEVTASRGKPATA
jgi:hypothetical protein